MILCTISPGMDACPHGPHPSEAAAVAAAVAGAGAAAAGLPQQCAQCSGPHLHTVHGPKRSKLLIQEELVGLQRKNDTMHVRDRKLRGLTCEWKLQLKRRLCVLPAAVYAKRHVATMVVHGSAVCSTALKTICTRLYSLWNLYNWSLLSQSKRNSHLLPDRRSCMPLICGKPHPTPLLHPRSNSPGLHSQTEALTVSGRYLM